MMKQPYLFIKASCIACEFSSCPNNPMTRNNDTDRIAAHSLPYRLCGHFPFSCADRYFPGNVTVGSYFPKGDGAEYLPDLFLKQSTIQMNGKIRFVGYTGKIGIQPAFD